MEPVWLFPLCSWKTEAERWQNLCKSAWWHSWASQPGSLACSLCIYPVQVLKSPSAVPTRPPTVAERVPFIALHMIACQYRDPPQPPCAPAALLSALASCLHTLVYRRAAGVILQKRRSGSCTPAVPTSASVPSHCVLTTQIFHLAWFDPACLSSLSSCHRPQACWAPGNHHLLAAPNCAVAPLATWSWHRSLPLPPLCLRLVLPTSNVTFPSQLRFLLQWWVFKSQQFPFHIYLCVIIMWTSVFVLCHKLHEGKNYFLFCSLSWLHILGASPLLRDGCKFVK